MKRARSRDTYLQLIDADRARTHSHAAEPRRAPTSKPQPPQPRADYKRKGELRGDLGRYYERCKTESARRFKGARLKEYCSAVAWTIVKRGGKYPDYPYPRPTEGSVKDMARRMPPRDPRTGKFRRRGSEPRRSPPRRASAAAAAPRRPHPVKGYSYRRRGRTVHVPSHRSAEAMYEPRRRGKRRGSPRRGGGRVQNIAIVPVGRERHGGRRYGRRRYYAREAPRATAGGLVLLGTGVLAGAWGANFLHRYIVTVDPASTTFTLPAGVPDLATYNRLVVDAKPSAGSIFAQLGLAAVGMLGGAFLPWAPFKLFSYGVGFGALGHVGVQLINGYIVEPMMKVGTTTISATGSRLFAHENDSIAALTPATSGASQGMMGAPGARSHAVASAPALPIAQPRDRMPSALAAGQMGQEGKQVFLTPGMVSRVAPTVPAGPGPNLPTTPPSTFAPNGGTTPTVPLYPPGVPSTPLNQGALPPTPPTTTTTAPPISIPQPPGGQVPMPPTQRTTRAKPCGCSPDCTCYACGGLKPQWSGDGYGGGRHEQQPYGGAGGYAGEPPPQQQTTPQSVGGALFRALRAA